MYTSHFGLSERPFAITPDPRYLYQSARHAEALAHLLYGITEGGGFVQLTGEVGTGKTTVVRALLARIPPQAEVAVILNPRVSPAEFLHSICEELGVAVAAGDAGSIKRLVDVLNRRLLAAHAAGRRVILIVDEAQNLSPEVLEQVRLLTNLETPTQKLLQILLIGQPELRDLLERTELRQLAQRVTGRYHLAPLGRDETRHYVNHRLRVAGASADIFSPAALREVHRLSRGIPRVINVCCDRALLGAYTRDLHRIGAGLVRRAAGEVYGRWIPPPWAGWIAAAGATAMLAAALSLGWRWWIVEAPRGTVARTVAALPATAVRKGPARTVAMPLPAGRVAKIATPAASLAATGIAPQARVAAVADAAALARWLDALPADDQGQDAFARLFALWGAPPPGGEPPCVAATRSGLACFEQSGSFAELQTLDRPAILALTDDHGRSHPVLLTALSDQQATLAAGGQSRSWPIAALSRAWFGRFTVLWRPKSAHVRVLAEGTRGAQVRGLRRSLAALDRTASDPRAADVYDHALTLAVAAFQRAHGLPVDGIAGVQTQVVLDAELAEPGSPRLQPIVRTGG
ncbi:MAG: AAA family ATPase [Gammaproteobacteria bacterium]|nr:AAA family ATPase [Gammaproteobacteria bacterium]